MPVNTFKEKIRFWRNWTLLNAAFVVIGYLLVIIVSILIMVALRLPENEWGSPLQQTIWKIGEGVIIGLSIGFIQLRLLRKIFNVSSFWLYSIVIGFIMVELIAGIICWKLDINRGDLSVLEGDSLGHSLVLSITGLMTGIIQFPLLIKHFKRSAYWIAASTVAWGISILLSAIDTGSEIGVLLFLILGILLYGALTGATLMWILKPKEIES